jgi:N-acetylglucosaminyldiphosphoundecaprenol N-acetyl-beta-D-mannosaminyltransferase
MTAVRERTPFLGVPVDLLDMAETRRAIADRIASGVPAAHLGVNAANLVLATDDAAYAADLAAADIVTADGQSVVWGARLFGIDVPERVTGIDLMEATLDDARAEGWGIYLLGARPEVVGRLAGLLAERGVRVVGHRDGYFGADEEERVAGEIRDSGATILYVGMPSPRKERFIVRVARAAGVPLSIGVGGSFDVLAGELRRAPRAVQVIGMEWVFRLLQEPRRLFRRYAVTNARFLWLMVVAAARRRPRIAPWR